MAMDEGEALHQLKEVELHIVVIHDTLLRAIVLQHPVQRVAEELQHQNQHLRLAVASTQEGTAKVHYVGMVPKLLENLDLPVDLIVRPRLLPGPVADHLRPHRLDSHNLARLVDARLDDRAKGALAQLAHGGVRPALQVGQVLNLHPLRGRRSGRWRSGLAWHSHHARGSQAAARARTGCRHTTGCSQATAWSLKATGAPARGVRRQKAPSAVP
mmetsp:Transcript_14588/g.37456  ORF Transcript_14588/g.37456 Transcript_14588/m.37456 type:complete len:214 (+) Transcript_14588:390-1031(+)